MKVLFLDIDGVVNHAGSSNAGLFPIDPVAAARVARIIAYTDCEIVLSSTWRKLKEGREIVSQKVAPIHDVTPDTDSYYRGDDIQAWLNKHPKVTRYAVLDDDADWRYDQEPHWFLTTWEKGLTEDVMQKVIDHLNERVPA